MSEYPKPQWGKAYRRYFPEYTCPMSRHVKVFSAQLRKKSDPVYKLVSKQDEPEHIAQSLEMTVIALWAARKRIAELEAQIANQA